MENKTHVNIFVYNPSNLKEVINKKVFIIKYIPTKKWNEYLILVNDNYCHHKLNIQLIFCNGENGERQSTRKEIANSIKNYIDNNFGEFKDDYKVQYPNEECKIIAKRTFNEIILKVKDFKNRDELTKYNLIDLN